MLAVAVVIRPAIAVYVALCLPLFELLLPTSALGIATLALLLVGVASGLRTAGKMQRNAAMLLLLLSAWVTVFGVVLAAGAPGQQGVAIAFISACALAACAVVSAPSTGMIVLYLAGWGLISASWVLRHPDQLTARSGDIFARENADGLGMIIAIGAVALVGYALERRRSLVPLAIVAAFISFQALVVTASRGALLTLLVGLFVAAAARAWVQHPAKVVVVSLVMAPVLWPASEWLTSWFLEASGRDIAVQHGFDLRSRLAQFAWEQGLAHPLTGIGVGRLPEIGVGTGGIGVSASAHNTFLGLLAAAGFPAVLFLTSLLFVAARRAAEVAPRLGLSTLSAVVAAGLSAEWWASGRLAPLFMLGIALSLVVEPRPHENELESDTSARNPKMVNGRMVAATGPSPHRYDRRMGPRTMRESRPR